MSGEHNDMQRLERLWRRRPPLRYAESPPGPRSWAMAVAFEGQLGRGYHCGHVAAWYRQVAPG